MKRKRALPFILGAVLLALITVALAKIDLLKVKSVEASDLTCASASEIKKALNLEGLNIFQLPKDLYPRVKKFLCLESINYQKEFPSKVKITTAERQAIARVVSYNKQPDLDLKEASVSSQTALIDWSFPVSSESSYFAVDKQGLIFTQTEDFDLPILMVPGIRVGLGEVISNPNLSKLPIILERLRSEVGFNVIKLDQNNLLVNSSPAIVFNIERDELIQLGSLQLLLQKAKIDGREIKIVDLRFNKPIVVYGRKK